MKTDLYTRNTRVRERERIERRAELQTDGFRITVDGRGTVTVEYESERALGYARKMLADLEDDAGMLPVAEVEDAPAFALRGVIEGFYGAPYTPEQREDLLHFLAAHRMNAYFYAPKDDPYHRDRWREPYPAAELEALARLVRIAKEEKLDFYYCISPGKDFGYAGERDYILLAEKLCAMRAVGVEDFAVLFDDVEVSLSPEAAACFSSVGEADCHVVNFVNSTVPHAHPLVFCPTDYYQDCDTPYREAVRRFLDPEISVFWTGHNVVAEAVTARDCRAARSYFGHPLVLWDNYPVNDFAPLERVYLGPVTNRTRRMAETHVGYVANLGLQCASSKFAVATMAEYAWDPASYDETEAYGRIVEELLGGGEAFFFCDRSKSSVLKRYPENGALFARGDMAALSAYYAALASAAEHVRRVADPALLAEWEDLLRAAEAECALFEALRKGGDLTALLAGVKELKLRLADQSIYRYIADMGMGEDVTLPERRVAWPLENVAE